MSGQGRAGLRDALSVIHRPWLALPTGVSVRMHGVMPAGRASESPVIPR